MFKSWQKEVECLLYHEPSQQWWPIPDALIAQNEQGFMEVFPGMAARAIASILLQNGRSAFSATSEYQIVYARITDPNPVVGEWLSDDMVIRGLNAK